MRSIKRLGLLLGALAALSVASHGWAEDKKDKDPQKLENKSDKCQCTCTIDFSAAFELPFEGLSTLCSRITSARRQCDPVCLCTCACELYAAEKASGKKAGLTSDQLFKECCEIAKRRGSSQELKAVAALCKDSEACKDLEQMAAKASEREEDEVKRAKSGEKQKGIGNLTVRNFTGYKIWIHVNDSRVGWVNPYGEYSFYLGQPHWKTAKLYGLSSCGTRQWGPQYVGEDHPQYTWSLNP